MIVFLNGKRLEPPLVQVPIAEFRVCRVPALRMSQSQPLKESRKFAILPRPEDQVPVRRHETVTDEAYTGKSLNRLIQDLLEGPIILVAMKDRRLSIAAIEGMVDDPADVDSERPSHADMLADVDRRVYKMVPDTFTLTSAPPCSRN
jgi:hypothetical protein